ncbi:hypothetical protein [Mariprofundus ferrooxydans]|uniref:hypothetical protein n=1 Tax=Mariprofundus ferrooxydans TaxID=314344 RepID=UPI001431C862|nr:hypothetical protein [Mariprofundus ferrooxydans]
MNHCYLKAPPSPVQITDEFGKMVMVTPPTVGECWSDPDQIAVPPDAVFTADWDGVSTTLANVVGTIPVNGLPFAGWPSK